MHATFVELRSFHSRRQNYLDDDAFHALQQLLLADPERGDLVRDAGGLRKMRLADVRRGKGSRGGLRIVYFWWERGRQFWLFAIYDKDEASDLRATERRALRHIVKSELESRSNA